MYICRLESRVNLSLIYLLNRTLAFYAKILTIKLWFSFQLSHTPHSYVDKRVYYSYNNPSQPSFQLISAQRAKHRKAIRFTGGGRRARRLRGRGIISDKKGFSYPSAFFFFIILVLSYKEGRPHFFPKVKLCRTLNISDINYKR